MEEGTSANANPNLRKPSLCDECGSNPWKYRCPGCSIRSCSLPCVNSHKKRTSCTGKRRLTESVPLSKFDDNLLLADYRFLEETKRLADSARRMINGSRCYFGFKLPTKLLMLRNAARRRRIKLFFFPTGMSRREINQSRYDLSVQSRAYHVCMRGLFPWLQNFMWRVSRSDHPPVLIRNNTIFWTLELRFHGTGVVLVHHGVDEHASLLSIFGKHLTPGPWNHKLRSFCDVQLDDLKLFIQTNPKNSKSQFRKLDIKTPMDSQLAKMVILEHPIIFVYLPTHEYYFEVETARFPFHRNSAPSPFDGLPSHNGTLYRVEEVEEGDVPSDTRVTDLMDCMKSAANCIKIPEEANVPSNTWVTNEISKLDNFVLFTDKQIPEATAGGFGHQLCGETHRALATNSPESGDIGFYFGQELNDAYSDLIGEINPDDFLCLDGVYDEGVDLGETRWYDLEEKRRDDAEEIRDAEVRGEAFEISKGNSVLKDFEERQGNVLKERREGYMEKKRENSFLSGGIPFGEMELEEGEIPCFL